MQHFSISDSAQDTAVHAVDLAIRFQEGRIVTAGDKGLFFPHPGQQILLAAIIQLAEHIVQQEDGVLPGDGGSGGGFGHFQDRIMVLRNIQELKRDTGEFHCVQV